jgi:hypothetical protein
MALCARCAIEMDTTTNNSLFCSSPPKSAGSALRSWHSPHHRPLIIAPSSSPPHHRPKKAHHHRPNKAHQGSPAARAWRTAGAAAIGDSLRETCRAVAAPQAPPAPRRFPWATHLQREGCGGRGGLWGSGDCGGGLPRASPMAAALSSARPKAWKYEEN